MNEGNHAAFVRQIADNDVDTHLLNKKAAAAQPSPPSPPTPPSTGHTSALNASCGLSKARLHPDLAPPSLIRELHPEGGYFSFDTGNLLAAAASSPLRRWSAVASSPLTSRFHVSAAMRSVLGPVWAVTVEVARVFARREYSLPGHPGTPPRRQGGRFHLIASSSPGSAVEENARARGGRQDGRLPPADVPGVPDLPRI